MGNDKMQYPLHFAAFKKQSGCVTALIESGLCDYTVTDRKGRIPAEDTSSETIREALIVAANAKEGGFDGAGFAGYLAPYAVGLIGSVAAAYVTFNVVFAS